ncbi:MAG: DUF3012 domain-containing protein [Proteobacteria bacterium]|nr:DUF3012 domain-containing protein [Pseudomonadota bacterium]
MRIFLIALSLVLLTACSVKPGSEEWCNAKKEQSKSEWVSGDAKIFAKHCIFDSQTIGSKKWCENMDEKEKGDWTATETGDYAKHCVL